MSNFTNTVFSINIPNVAHESIDGEVIVINLISGNYYSLQTTGAEIWVLLDRGYSSSTIESIILSKYTSDSINISNAVSQFLAELEREELITSKNQDIEEPLIEQSMNVESVAFTIPKIDRYSDMQELLLLDPIHDVDKMGWPKATV